MYVSGIGRLGGRPGLLLGLSRGGPSLREGGSMGVGGDRLGCLGLGAIVWVRTSVLGSGLRGVYSFWDLMFVILSTSAMVCLCLVGQDGSGVR
jgi:hypothetical protein